MSALAGDVRGLFEREGDLATIDRALSATLSGEGSVLAVEGPAGIGKSRLLEVLVDQARAGQARVLRARGGALERDFAFGVARQLLEKTVVDSAPEARAELLEGAAGMAGSVLGVGGSGNAVDVSYTVMHGLYWLVANLTEPGPLVLVVDDLHWADAPSVRFLAHLAPRLEGLPVLVALGLRTGEPDTDPLVEALCADPALVAVTPEPLSPSAVNDVLARVFGVEPAPDFAEACHKTSGGNPFLLGELTNALVGDGIEPSSANAAMVKHLGPETLSRALLLRLTRLPAGADQLAAAVAVLGTDVELRHAAALAELELDRASEVADSLASVQILAPGRPLEFVHPVVREAIHADLTPSERTTLHRRAAAQLRAGEASHEALAPHLLATEPSDDPELVATLRAAAAAALERGAAETAQRYLRRALAERGPEPDLLAELGAAEWLAGTDREAAREHLRASLEATDDPVMHALRGTMLARVTFAEDDVPGAFRIMNDVIERGGRLPPEVVNRLEAERGSLIVLQPPMSKSVFDALEAYADLPGETVDELLLMAPLAGKHWLTRSADDAAELALRSLGDGRLVESEGSDTIAIYQAIWSLAYADRHEQAQTALDATLADARARGSIFGISCAHVMRALVAWRAGDVRACEAEARGAIDVGQIPPFARPLAWAHHMYALVERGALDQAEAASEAFGLSHDLPNLHPMNPIFYARARLRLAQGRPEEALADFEELARRDEELGQRNPGVGWQAGAVRALLAGGRDDEAVAMADDMLMRARNWNTNASIGLALCTAGVAAGGDVDRLTEAVAVLGDSPARLDLAHAQVELGAALRRSGLRREAREPLRNGLELARQLGSTALVQRAHEELITAGAKPRRLMFSGAESLTAAERRVALMAADDLTNRDIAQALFVTAKTVENHLSRCYSKLGITSRAELPTALAELTPTS
jgi:DNA-binding CsgD family transcriptional regulator